MSSVSLSATLVPIDAPTLAPRTHPRLVPPDMNMLPGVSAPMWFQISPDALAGLVTAPAGWIPGIGGGGAKRDVGEKDAEKAERVRRELEDVLAAQCPMCEGVVAGLDKPFVQPGEVDASWDL